MYNFACLSKICIPTKDTHWIKSDSFCVLFHFSPKIKLFCANDVKSRCDVLITKTKGVVVTSYMQSTQPKFFFVTHQ